VYAVPASESNKKLQFQSVARPIRRSKYRKPLPVRPLTILFC
jgi:hypothetical protein